MGWLVQFAKWGDGEKKKVLTTARKGCAHVTFISVIVFCTVSPVPKNGLGCGRTGLCAPFGSFYSLGQLARSVLSAVKFLGRVSRLASHE